MPRRPSNSPVQKQVRDKLWEIYGRAKSWEGVHRETGINGGQANAVARGKQPASRRMIKLLIPPAERKRRTPWKKKYRLLRKFITRRIP
jgi:hypothetical protein